MLGKLTSQKQQCGCVILDDGRLLVVGGRDELRTLSTVEAIYLHQFNQITTKPNLVKMNIATTHKQECKCNLTNNEANVHGAWKVVSSLLTNRLVN